jgi:hypothetical protein
MATRARIIAEIPNEMKGKTFSFKNDKDYKYRTPDTTIPNDAKYVSVYVHWDGYEDGVGKELLNDYTNFNDIMENIMCGGDCSCIGTPYHAWRNEDFDDTKPNFTRTLDDIYEEEYNYLFTVENKWYVKSDYNKEYAPFGKKMKPIRTDF